MHPRYGIPAESGAIDKNAMTDVTRRAHLGHLIRPDVDHTVLLSIASTSNGDVDPIAA